MKRDKVACLALIVLVLLAFGLRLFRLGAQDLWGDEAFSAWLAQRPLSTIMKDLSQGEPHPPFYPLLLWAWVKFAGHGEFALRFVSLLFGTAMVPLAAALGRRLQGWSLALISALVVAINPFLVWYSQETRMYIVVAAFALLAAIALLDMARNARRAWLAFALAATLMIYSHYYGLLVLASFALVLVVVAFRRGISARNFIFALGLIALLYLPWVVYASRIFFSYSGVAVGRVDLRAVFDAFWLRSTSGWAITPEEATRWLPLFLLLAAIGVFAAFKEWFKRGQQGAEASAGDDCGRRREMRRSARLPLSRVAGSDRKRAAVALQVPNGSTACWRVTNRNDYSLLLLAAWLSVPLLGGYAISSVRPMFAERYLIVCTVPLLLLVASGILALRRLWPPLVIAALLLVVLANVPVLRAQYLDPRYLKSEYSQHAEQVQGLASVSDGIILDGASQQFLFDYYYKGSLPHYPVPSELPLNEDVTAKQLKDLAAKHSGLWAFLYATHDYDPTDFVERWLSENAFRAWHTWTVNGRLVHYATYPASELKQQSGSARFGDRLELLRFGVRGESYSAGQVIPLLFRWRALSALDQDYKVSVRLTDSDGTLWGQTDAEPVSGFRPTHFWKQGDEVDDRLGVLITPGTPPGRYDLELRVYPPSGPQLLPSANALSVKGTALGLGEVVVSAPSRHATGVSIPAFRPIAATFENRLVLEGESGVGEVTAGQSAYLTVLWRAIQAPLEGHEALLRLIDRQGNVASETVAKPYNGDYSVDRWQAGDVLRWQYDLRVSPRVRAGDYRLILLLRSSSGKMLPVGSLGNESSLSVELQRIVVKPRPKPPVAGRPQVPLDVVFGDKAALRGYTLQADKIVPGGKLALTLYWEPLADFDTAYTVFAHLIDQSERVWAQQDAQPCSGSCPTTSWVPGDIVEDHYEMTIKAEAAAGEYLLELGLYDPRNGQRLTTKTNGQPSGDRVLLPKLSLQPR